MKAQNWIIPILLLFSVNGAWMWRSVRESRYSDRQMERLRDRYSGIEREIYLMRRGWNFATRSDGNLLPGNLRVRLDNQGTATLGEMVGDTVRLLFVLSRRHCSSCIDELLFTLKQAIPETGRSRVNVIYSSEPDDSGVWEYRRKILPGVRFLGIPESGLHLAADSLDVPYLTVVGRGLKTRHTFVPYPSLADQTESYLRLIVNKYLIN